MTRNRYRNLVPVVAAALITWAIRRVKRPAARDQAIDAELLGRADPLVSERPPRSEVKELRLRSWALPLVVVAVGLSIVTSWFARDLILRPSIERPTGGLILFASGQDAQHASADVSAELRETGWTGVSELQVTLEFVEPPNDLVLYAIASGQYAPPKDVEVYAFCTGSTPVVDQSTYRCRSSEIGMGLDNATYRAGGLGIVKNGSVHAITDYSGWDDRDSLVLQGRVSPVGSSGLREGEVRFNFPVSTPTTVSRGGESDGALAPIAGTDDGETGLGRILRKALNADDGLWAETQTGQAFFPLEVSAVSLDAGEVEPTAAVTRSSPSTSSSNHLRWADPGLRRRGVTYTVTDSNKTNSALLTSLFHAGPGMRSDRLTAG